MYFMFRLNAGFGLIILCAFPFLVGVIGLCLWRANPLLSRLQAHLDAINEIMQEDVSGIRIMKACVREAYEKTRFGKANGELVRTQLKTLVIFAFMNPLTNAIMYLAVTVILLAGSFLGEKGSTGKCYGGADLYHPAFEWYSDAGHAVPEYFQRARLMETGKRSAGKRAGTEGRLFRRGDPDIG